MTKTKVSAKNHGAVVSETARKTQSGIGIFNDCSLIPDFTVTLVIK